ncbi:MAG: phosphoribosylformylglycinamidine synthase subunit PurQ [Cytophagales bacterium]|nr:phosphoribosylformylglycinamidine synthase subunit PurQ [Bernardetiaceae bacterium]MDW8204369.1 phosphoribosylformylglycinamidine synthase subunit PurQ [Cytophagales bacterium]
MKFGVVVFPGSNCDDDMIFALRDVLGQPAVKLWHKSHDLQDCELIVLPGGFSYGDYLRSGAIARFSPIMQEVIAHAQKGGYVMGICNGFQILTEAGLLPGALLRNTNRKYICKNVYLKPITRNTLLTQGLRTDKTYQIPIAHGEGRYYAPPALLEEIRAHDQILFKYCNQAGAITEEANPNGSVDNIAGICNKKRNVFGMMPHPERACHPMLGNTDGYQLLASLIEKVLV